MTQINAQPEELDNLEKCLDHLYDLSAKMQVQWNILSASKPRVYNSKAADTIGIDRYTWRGHNPSSRSRRFDVENTLLLQQLDTEGYFDKFKKGKI